MPFVQCRQLDLEKGVDVRDGTIEPTVRQIGANSEVVVRTEDNVNEFPDGAWTVSGRISLTSGAHASSEGFCTGYSKRRLQQCKRVHGIRSVERELQRDCGAIGMTGNMRPPAGHALDNRQRI